MMSLNRPESQAVHWSSPMVGEWLVLLGLGEYSPRFFEEGVDGPILLELRKDQFERCLGVTSRLHELSLRLGLLDLKTKSIDYSPGQWEWTGMGVIHWLTFRGLEQLVSRFRSGAVHGGVLFRLTRAEFQTYLHVGELGESELVLDSLCFAIERAKKVGFFQDPCSFLDWGPQEVYEWLETMDLSHLNDKLRTHAVNGTLLPHLDEVSLRRTINLSEIQTLRLSRAIKALVSGKTKFMKESVGVHLDQENHNPNIMVEFREGRDDEDDDEYYAIENR